MNKLFAMACMALTLAFSCATPPEASAKPEPAPTAKPEPAATSVAAKVDGPKLVALTFDDGPSAELTPLVLDKLEAYGVPATFFLIGQLINDSTKPVLERALSLGCEFGNHSWAWDSMNSMSDEAVAESVLKTSDAIEKYTGTRPKFFRPPNLAVSFKMYKAVGLPFAEGVLAFDWAGTGTDAAARADNVLKEVRDGAIVLMHDVQPLPHPTPEALDILIPELKAQGYEFVTLSELFARKGIDPTSKTSAMWKFVE